MSKNVGIKHSFASRLTFWLFLMLLVALTPISWMTSHFLDDVANSQTRRVCENSLMAMKEKTRRQLSDVYVAVNNQVHEVEEHMDNLDELSKVLKRFVELNPQIYGSAVAFEPYYFKQHGKWMELYAMIDSTGNVQVKQIGGEGHDYFQAQWYQETKKSPRGYWSDAYYDDAGGKQAFVTFSVPLHDKDGHMVAVFDADLSLEELANYVEKMDSLNADPTIIKNHDDFMKYASHSFILDRNGAFITHRDKSKILKWNFFKMAEETPGIIDDGVCEDMKNNRQGYVQIDALGVPSHMFYMPVKIAGWTLATVVPNDYVHAASRKTSIIHNLLMVLAGILVMLVCLFTARRITEPLTRLAVSVDEVANGNFDASLPIVKHRDEIHMLRDSFEDMQHSLSQYMKDLEKTAASKAAIEKELKIAYNIQMSMVPQKYPPYPKRHDIDVYGHMTPAKSVGGDLFDFLLRDEQLFFCIGDVSGKSVPAALVMTVARKLFHGLSIHEDRPEMMMKYINNSIADGNDMNMFVTLFIGRLDLATGHLCYCNGGHEAPVLIGNGVSRLPVKPNLPVGLIPDMVFVPEEADIQPDTTIFLFTDGLTEAEDKDEKFYGIDRFLEMVKGLASKEDQMPQKLMKHTLESIHAFVGEAEQSDDLTMLAIRYFGPEQL